MSEKKIKITIPGDPIPWARPGQSGKTRFNDQKAEMYAAGMVAKVQMRAAGLTPFVGPIRAQFQFLMPIPKYRKNEIVGRLIAGDIVWHFVKPDTSNLIKFYEDAFNGIVFGDDCQIADLSGWKQYDVIPETIVTVGEL